MGKDKRLNWQGKIKVMEMAIQVASNLPGEKGTTGFYTDLVGSLYDLMTEKLLESEPDQE